MNAVMPPALLDPGCSYDATAEVKRRTDGEARTMPTASGAAERTP